MQTYIRTQQTGSWTVLLLLLVAMACGDDDGFAEPQIDAGLFCDRPAAIDDCYCSTGTLGLRYCNGVAMQWGACMCNEPMPQPPCTEGSLLSCACPDGTMSTQLCRASNTRDPCMCMGHLLMDAGDEDASDIDGG